MNSSIGKSPRPNTSVAALMCSPSISENGRRRISLVGKVPDPRKSLPNFEKAPKSTENQQQQQPIQAQQEFRVTLNSLHEINSKFFNPTNAFRYNFINYIDSFINKDKVDFKIVAMSLDAGTKVYTSKVDLVYNNSQKISSTLTMATDDVNVFDDDGCLLDRVDLGRKNERRKKKPRKNIVTVASNMDSLNAKLEINIEIDPLFHHLSAAFDVGNVNSLLMANLKVDPNGTMLLDSGSSLNFDTQPEIVNRSIDFPFLKPSYALENCYICKPYSNFEFSKRDTLPELEEVTSGPNTETVDLNFNFDLNADVDDIPEPVEELDFVDNDFHSELDSETRTDTENNAPDILQILPESNENNQFFNRDFLRETFKRTNRYQNLQNNDNQADKPKDAPKKPRQVYLPNTYDEKPSEDMFEVSDTISYLPNTVLKWAEQAKQRKIGDVLINHSLALFTRCYTRNMSFPEIFRSKYKKSHRNEQDDNEGEFDHDDLFHDDDDYGERLRDEFPERQDDDGQLPFDVPDSATTEEQPMHVDALDIDYAKVAKKIDIKKVKYNMWNVIKQTTTENSQIQQQPDTSKVQDTPSSQSELTFTGLRQNLSVMLNPNLNEKLSTQISFVALLHLCNEKNLKLSNKEELSDFVIDVP